MGGGAQDRARRLVTWSAVPSAVVPAAAAGAVFVSLAASATRYGWHRDELYFVVAGRHPAWGYPDQPPLTPLMVSGLEATGGLVAVRLGAAVITAALVLVTAATAGALGGGARARGLAAVVAAVGPFALISGHVFTTTVPDVLLASVVVLLLVRALRDVGTRAGDVAVLAAGVVTGVGMLNKLLIVGVPAAVLVGVLVVGPRSVLRRPATWVAPLLSLAIGWPTPAWQAQNGWPQRQMGSVIADDFEPLAFVVEAIGIGGLLLAPVLVAGVVLLLRSPGLRWARSPAVGAGVLLVLVVVSQGKAYYLAGFAPVLVAAGAIATDRWLVGPGRRALLAAGIAVQAVATVVVALPLIPEVRLAESGVTAINDDAAETVGWPRLVDTVALVTNDLPAERAASAIVLAGNYGQAGALTVVGEGRVPAVYSGHNGFAAWGPPPADASPVVVVGYRLEGLRDDFAGCRLVATVDNGVSLDNEEQGAPVVVCEAPRRSWVQLWPDVAHLD